MSYSILLFVIIPFIIVAILWKLTPKVEKYRNKKLKKLLSEKYSDLLINTNGIYEFTHQNKLIRIEYKCDNLGKQYHNNYSIYLDISNLDNNLKNLCKIHFNSKRINEKDWITEAYFFSWRNSIKYFVRNSDKRIEKLITKLEDYLEQKR